MSDPSTLPEHQPDPAARGGGPLAWLDYIFLMRPILFFPGWTSLLSGYLVALRGEGPLFDRFWVSPEMGEGLLAIAMISFALNMGGCFILNQLCDIETDRANQKLFFLGEGMIPIRRGIWQSVLALTIALLLAMGLGMAFFWLSLLFAVVTGYAYNYPPLEMKSYPLPGLLANMVMGWLAFVLGYCLKADVSTAMVVVSLPFLFFNSGLYLLTTLPDVAGDRASGKETLPVRYGQKNTLLLGALLLAGALTGALLLGELLPLFPSLLALLLALSAYPGDSISRVLLAIKMGLFAFSVMVCLKLPAYLLLIIAAYYFTRYYYRKRFNLEYPSFKGS